MDRNIRPAFYAVAFALGLAAGPAAAQQATSAQQSAIRAACPSDFRANCSGVSPGGQAALACLQQNMAKLSAPCAQAVGALSPPAAAAPAPAAPAESAAPAAPAAPAPAAPAAAPAPAPAAPAAAAPPAAAPAKPAAASAQPTQAQQSAIRSACQSDFRANCAGVQPGGQAALACLQRNAGKLSPACRSAVGAVSGGAPAATAAPRAAPPPPPSVAQPAPRFIPLTPRQELMVLRAECGPDFRRLCQGVPLGGGRAMGCLRANAANLSPGCQQVLISR